MEYRSVSWKRIGIAATLRRTALAGLALLACTGVCFSQTAVQNYPDHPVRLIVPFSVGGATDIMARQISRYFLEDLKQPLVIENRGGAGGMIGTELVAHAPPDGYTLLFASSAQLAVNPSLYAHVRYDSLRDFDPILLIGATPNVILASPASGIDSIAALVARAKAKPGALNFASPGVGSTAHLSAEMLQQQTGIKLVHVPYKGGGAVLMDALGGETPVVVVAIPSIVGYAQSGKLVPLAVTGPRRSAVFPAVPTVAETLPGFEAVAWYGIVAPAGTPPAILLKLKNALQAIIKREDVQKAYAAQGIEPIDPSIDFAAYLKSERVKWAHVIELSGARVE